MLNWKIKNGDEKLRAEIKRVKGNFEGWFESSWSKRVSREEMLSEQSPVEHVYYKMIKSEEEIKKKFPYEALECCSDCGEYVDEWIESEFSFCEEYNCGMVLCKECASKLVKLVDIMK